MARNKVAKIRLSEDEWNRLKNKARSLLGSDNVSQYIRKKCLSFDLGQEEMIVAIHKKIVLENNTGE